MLKRSTLPQRIARPAHGAQWIRTAIAGEYLAQTPDVDVDGPGVDVDVAPPDPVEKLLAAPDPARFLHEGGEQTKFGRTKLQVFTVRKEPKGHGKGKQIEGNFKDGDTVIVVDDVITTGGSTLKAVDAIEREGGKVAFCLVLVDREEGGKQAIEERGIPVIPLFSRHNLLDE